MRLRVAASPMPVASPATDFRIDANRTSPRAVTRAGIGAIEAIFKFETAEGRGSGVFRLTPDAGGGDTLQGVDAVHRTRRT